MTKHIVFILVYYVIYCTANQPHLGCYKEDKNDRDLTEEIWSNRTDSSQLNITHCMISCQTRGFAYAGLGLGATECWCGSSYGKHGVSEDCVYVCIGFPGYKCGGSQEYNIYYTVQQVPTCPANSQLVARQPYDVCLTVPSAQVKTYEEARDFCILQNQEVVAVTSDKTLSIVEELLTNSSNGDASVWVGLTKPTSTGTFKWTSKHEETYSAESISQFWTTGHPNNNHLCVLYNSQTGKLESGNCSDKKLIICQTTLNKTSIVIHKSIGDKIAEFFSDKGNLALIIIVVLIAMTVVGCCIVYSFHKKAKEKRKQEKINGRSRMTFT
ncbi:uncharacterized protein LOC126826141 isoform X2 [Patella vulgata]|uniref:uncharacterized protein LOC126826141 isoform X2 n=1 Tax=Patella vulgata TaxID=6465 RepID=UPI00217F9E50|nr:uncharacterized protein LOC126826141 isoform X2 [Patella vulgata]